MKLAQLCVVRKLRLSSLGVRRLLTISLLASVSDITAAGGEILYMHAIVILFYVSPFCLVLL